jgi:hypothetical protein
MCNDSLCPQKGSGVVRDDTVSSYGDGEVTVVVVVSGMDCTRAPALCGG